MGGGRRCVITVFSMNNMFKHWQINAYFCHCVTPFFHVEHDYFYRVHTAVKISDAISTLCLSRTLSKLPFQSSTVAI